MPLRYLHKLSRSSYVLFVKFGCVINMSSDVLSLVELLDETQENGEELRISTLGIEVLHVIRAGFVFLFIDWAGFYIFKPRKLSAFIFSSFYQFVEQLLSKLYHL